MPPECEHNGHMFYVLLPPTVSRVEVLQSLKADEIGAVFHYVPLHSAAAGLRYGRAHGTFENTDALSARLIRLPLWVGITPAEQQRVANRLAAALGSDAAP